MVGWIKIHRKLQSWEWYTDSQVVHLFLHFLLEANHEDRKWKGVMIKRGQLIFGRKRASETLGISEQSIRTCITRLKSTNEITTKSTNKFTLVTIVNYDQYQVEDKKSTSKSTSENANEQPTTNQQLTTPKELKNTTNVVGGHPLCVWISQTQPNVSKLKTQLSDREAERLVKKYDKALIREIVEEMDNKATLTKEYNNTYKTICSWIRWREKKNPGSTIKKSGEDHSARDDFHNHLQAI